MSDPLINRHDMLILFEVTNGNPNGDPDSGNMPRVDPISSLGLVSDVCLKRKIRNYVDLFPIERNGRGFNILIKQGAIIETEQKKAIEATKREGKGDAKRTRDWLCNEFYDVRTFGAVISTGDDVMKGSAYGQVRGPVQFTFGRSYHAVTPIEITITRCAVTKESEAKKERTMGQKYIVPYALYAAKCYVSPAFARQTGFDQFDFDVLIQAMSNIFEHDRSAARGDMVVRGLWDFEHVGSQEGSNSEQNRREAGLGCAHAHKLFDTIKVRLADETKLPNSFQDYQVHDDFSEHNFKGVKLHRRIDPKAQDR